MNFPMKTHMEAKRQERQQIIVELKVYLAKRKFIHRLPDQIIGRGERIMMVGTDLMNLDRYGQAPIKSMVPYNF